VSGKNGEYSGEEAPPKISDARGRVLAYVPARRGPGREAVFARWIFDTPMSDTAFDCVACGACCFSRNPRYLVLLPEDRERDLPKDSLIVDGERRFVDFSCGHCVHLDLTAGQAICTVYDNRPEACRAFRAGSFECGKAIRANGILGEKVREVRVA